MEHPMTPPPELVQQWTEEHQAIVDGSMYVDDYIATQAARWGADKELKACVEWLLLNGWGQAINNLRAARRPKPPSLAAKALDAAEGMSDCMNDGYLPNRSSLDTIRRALERLQELEKGNE